ncbi:CapA family protein [Streptomyces albiaxialis]|uniref:CapA family protein n=1 Tax=Streptomyces albiaxialis TaxID=329523 RepID=A0ABN2WA52_9ACTN
MLIAAALLGSLASCGDGGDGEGDGGTVRSSGEHGRAGDADRSKGKSPAAARAAEDDDEDDEDEKLRPFSLVATGDLLVHDSIIRQARADSGGSGYDFRTMLAAAKPVASKADLAICHMETVYGEDDGPFSGYPAFVTPPQLARAVKDTGYDSCSTASNHTLDDGSDGVERTLDAMDEAGLRHAGSARSEAESTRPAMLRAGGANVAQLAYTYGTNGIPLPEDKPWTVNMIDRDRIIADARAARKAGADVVVVSLHWGTEWQEAPDATQKSLSRKLTASRSGGRKDIDLILGTHAHVPQAYEKVNGTWVVHGMGDQIAGKMDDPRGTMGSAARFTFAPPRTRDGSWTVRKAEYLPFLMETTPRHTLVNLAAPAARKAGYERQRAFSTITEAVLSRGAAKDGLRLGR